MEAKYSTPHAQGPLQAHMSRAIVLLCDIPGKGVWALLIQDATVYRKLQTCNYIHEIVRQRLPKQHNTMQLTQDSFSKKKRGASGGIRTRDILCSRQINKYVHVVAHHTLLVVICTGIPRWYFVLL